ncbi:MAG TPA: prolyl oligopeptidase family serine peptidase [Terriglobales bacterium]|nr:prolyl oligopeptidase family serine peptidase [Terriglobales bacterium]
MKSAILLVVSLLVLAFFAQQTKSEPFDVKAHSPAFATPASKQQVKQWRRQIRQALFVPDPLPELKPETHGSFSPVPGVVAERVSYGTEFGMRIPAIVYRPESSKKKMPGIVVVDGHGGDKTAWYSYYTGVLYAQAGAVVVTYDPIGSEERNDDHEPLSIEHDKIIEIPTLPQRMGGLMITDAMQGVSYLRSRSDVDGRRIAVLGFSMGSFVSALTGAVDERIHALVLTGGGDLDGPGGYWDSSYKVMCQSGPYKALNFLGDRGAALFTLNARRGPTFIVNGLADTVVDIPHHAQDFFQDLRSRVVAINGSDKNVFETEFIPGAGHRPTWLERDTALWLDRQLSFPNWTRAEIEKKPIILIRDWAEKTGVRLSKSAAALRDDHEGGLPALQANVPGLSADQLDVLPREDWQKVKEDFVYPSWVAHATSAAHASEQ